MTSPLISTATLHRARQLILVMLLSASTGWSHAADPKASKYFEDALVRYEKKDFPGAIIQLKNALQIDPNMMPVQVLLGKALLQNGDVPAAEVALLEALRLGVNRAEVVLPLGQAYLAMGKQKLLIEQQHFLPAGLPSNIQVEVLLLRAAAFADLGDVRTALKTIDEARAIDGRSIDVWLAEVPLRIRARQFREAYAAVDKALALAPNSAGVWYLNGTVAHAAGDLKATLAAYDRVLQIDAKHVKARVARAGIYIDLGRDADASKDVAEVQRLSPKEPLVSYMKALLAERANNIPEMRAALSEVTSLIDPVPVPYLLDRPQILMLNGMAHFALGEMEKARLYLELFQRGQSNSPVAKLLAEVYFRESNPGGAVDVLEAYLRAQPRDAQAMNMLASAHMSQGRHAKATALMQEALKSRDSPELRTTLGLSMLRGGRSSDGVAELEAAYRKSPGQLQAGTALIGLYLRGGQTAKAVAIAEALIKQFPSNAGLFNLLGLARAQGGHGPAARAAFEQALKLDKTLTAAKVNLARLDMATQAYDAAANRLSGVLKEDEKNTEAMYEMASLSDRRGQPAEAQRWLEKATDLSGPTEVRWGLALVEFHLRNGSAAAALEVAKRMSDKAPEDVAVLLARGRAQLGLGDPVGARTTFTEATRFAEYSAPLQVEIAALQMLANNLDGATYSLEKALSGRPDFLPAIAMMTEVEIRRGEFAKAEARARDIVARLPRRAVGHGLLGAASMARGQMAPAIEHYRRAHQVEPSTQTLLWLFRALTTQDGGKPALQLAEQWLKTNPRDVVVRKALADGYARAGNYAAARAAYESVLKAAPDDAEVLNNLANVLLRLKDPAAIKVAELALAKNPGNPNNVDTLGWVLFQNGQTDRALTLLRDARLRDPSNPEMRYHLAVVLAQTGRKNEARDELLAALKSGSSFELAAEAQALLNSLK